MTGSEKAELVFVVGLFVVLFLPLVLATVKAEPPYNPHSPYWKRKNRGKRR